MKRLVKNLFAGFVCSVLLMGCEGQDLENNYNYNTPSTNNNVVEEQKETPVTQQPKEEPEKEYYTLPDIYNVWVVNDYGQTLPRAQSDQVDIKTINVQGVFDQYRSEFTELNGSMTYYLGEYLDPHASVTLTLNENVFSQFTTGKEVVDYADKHYLGLAYSMYRDLANINYFGGYYSFTFKIKVPEYGYVALYYKFQEDSMSVDTKLNVSTDGFRHLYMPEVVSLLNSIVDEEPQQQEEPQQEQNPVESEPQQEQNPVESEPQQNSIADNITLTHYSETGRGESVFNVYIENDSLQTADINYYYQLVAENAMGCDYVVLQFPDNYNAVIDNNTLDVIYNQDLNYYRN